MSVTTTWTVARILDGIRARAAAGLSLAAADVKHHDRPLLDAAQRLLDGDWHEALERAAERYPQMPQIAQALDAYRPAKVIVDADTPGGQLRAARRRAGLSQSAAAKIAGVTQATWSLYESGARNMRPPDAAWRAVGVVPGGPPPKPPGVVLSMRVTERARAIAMSRGAEWLSRMIETMGKDLELTHPCPALFGDGDDDPETTTPSG